MRGKQAPKRRIAPDRKYNNTQVSKFINYVMTSGKKGTAERIVYGAFDLIEEKTGTPGFDIWMKAIHNLSPSLEVRARRIGGANYQVPVEVRQDRRFTLACRWLLAASRARKGASMEKRLADEIMAAANGEGDAMRKKEDVIRMAESNRAFAHFA